MPIIAIDYGENLNAREKSQPALHAGAGGKGIRIATEDPKASCNRDQTRVLHDGKGGNSARLRQGIKIAPANGQRLMALSEICP